MNISAAENRSECNGCISCPCGRKKKSVKFPSCLNYSSIKFKIPSAFSVFRLALIASVVA